MAWLATQCSKTAITQLMRIAWRTVGAIIARVWADIDDVFGDRLDGVRRLVVDEIARRGYRYRTVVVDHGSGRLLWGCARLRPRHAAGVL